MKIVIQLAQKPRLYSTADRADFRFDPLEDEFRRWRATLKAQAK